MKNVCISIDDETALIFAEQKAQGLTASFVIRQAVKSWAEPVTVTSKLRPIVMKTAEEFIGNISEERRQNIEDLKNWGKKK